MNKQVLRILEICIIRSAFAYFQCIGGGGEDLVYGSLSSSFMAFLCVLQ